MALGITEKGLNGAFMQQYMRADLGWLRQLTGFKSSNQALERYAGLGTVPGLQEFTGTHQYSTLGKDSYEVRNKTFTGGVEFDKWEWLEDKLGAGPQRSGELADAARDYQEQLAIEVFVNNSLLGYDGKALFADDHVTRASGTQDNNISLDVTTTTAPTVAEMRSAIFKAIQAILGFKDDQGRYTNRNATDFIVVVPLTFMEAAMGAVNNPIVGSDTNTLQNQRVFNVTAIAEPLLASWTEAFAVFVANKGQKAIWLQERGGIETHVIGPESELWKIQKRARFGVEWNGIAVPGWWQMACKVTLT